VAINFYGGTLIKVLAAHQHRLSLYCTRLLLLFPGEYGYNLSLFLAGFVPASKLKYLLIERLFSSAKPFTGTLIEKIRCYENWPNHNLSTRLLPNLIFAESLFVKSFTEFMICRITLSIQGLFYLVPNLNQPSGPHPTGLIICA